MLTGFTRGLVASVGTVLLIVAHNILGQTNPIPTAPLILLTTWGVE